MQGIMVRGDCRFSSTPPALSAKNHERPMPGVCLQATVRNICKNNSPINEQTLRDFLWDQMRGNVLIGLTDRHQEPSRLGYVGATVSDI